MASRRHRPYGLHAAGGLRRYAAPVPFSYRRRRIPQRANARTHRHRSHRRFVHRRNDRRRERFVAHRPRLIAAAYLAGNDLFDAEAFDEFDRSDGIIQRAVQGWQVKDVVSRADTWFVVSALRAAGAWASQHQRAEAKPIEAAAAPP